MASPLIEFLRGRGRIVEDAGNMANASGSPPVQGGENWQYLQDYQTHLNFATTEIAPVPPAYRNQQTFGYESYGLSGLTGGGIIGNVPQYQEVNSLYYDPQTGMYISL